VAGQKLQALWAGLSLAQRLQVSFEQVVRMKDPRSGMRQHSIARLRWSASVCGKHNPFGTFNFTVRCAPVLEPLFLELLP
jgi:hypothetical protein